MCLKVKKKNMPAIKYELRALTYTPKIQDALSDCNFTKTILFQDFSKGTCSSHRYIHETYTDLYVSCNFNCACSLICTQGFP